MSTIGYFCNAIVLACLSWFVTSCFIVHFFFNVYPTSLESLVNPSPENPVEGENYNDISLPVKQQWQEAENEYGAMGTAVKIPLELQEKAKETYDIHQFNLVASDLMSVNRELPDYRSKRCQRMVYPEDLPDVSVVIVFHNEAWSTLIRTLHSIINRTPRKLIRDIILVDDFSKMDYLMKPLDDYVRMLPVKITIIRGIKREGLIKCRLKGTSIAKGNVLVFLDSHCECSEGWLEPLLYEIYKDSTTVTWPIIFSIYPETFEVVDRNLGYNGGFDWRLHYLWEKDDEVSESPVRSPVFSGGIFAINRGYFFELGEYDKDMDVWGFENIEISLRIWMCGGQILIVPCSFVNHVFRNTSPYTWPGGLLKIISHNSQRVLNVWLDQYANLTYLFCPDMKGMPYGDITVRKNLRQKLKCKSFQWYIDNVYPTLRPITKLRGALKGEVKNEKVNKCLDVPAKLIRLENQRVRISQCSATSFNQRFVYTSDKQLINFLNLCMDWVNNTVTYSTCENGGAKWEYDVKSLEFRFASQPSSCLDARSADDGAEYPTVAKCDGSQHQQWIIIEEPI